MDDEIREELTKKVINAINSFNNAVEIAGRNPISLVDMEKMTLFHFICHVAAPNGIRFIRVPPEDKSVC